MGAQEARLSVRATSPATGLSAAVARVPRNVLFSLAVLTAGAIVVILASSATAAFVSAIPLPRLTFPGFVIVASSISTATVAAAIVVERRAHAVALSIAGAMAVVATNAGMYTRHYSDDAYITLRYARNLAGGDGPVWNPGERVEGYTDFLWMISVAALHVLGADLVDASLLLSYASAAALLVVLWRIWLLWADENGGTLARPAVFAVTALLVALNDSIVFWGFSGLETAMAAALLSLTAWTYMRESRVGGPPWSAVAAAAAAMTRPELAAIAVLTAAFVARDALFSGERDWRRVLRWLAVFGALFGAYFAWRWAYYGYPLPNTFYAKVGSNLDFANRGAGYLHAYGSSYLFLPFILGAAVLLFAAPRQIRRDAQYVLACVAVWAAVVMFEGGDAFAHGRFIAPIVPLVYVAGVAGIAVMLGRTVVQPRQVAYAGLAIAALSGLLLMRGSADPTLEADRRAHNDRKELGLWLRDHVPTDYTVATYASGAVNYYAQTRGLDMFGLTDETIAHSSVPDFGEGIAGHEKYNIDYVIEERLPEVIVLGDRAPFVMTRSLILRLRGGLAAYNALIDDDRTWYLYEPAAVSHDGRWYNFLVRKDVIDGLPFDWTESTGLIAR
jgi:hypothetical protein